MADGASLPLRADYLERPLSNRFSERHRGFAAAMQRHADAVSNAVPAYRDPVTGLMVFTAAFLAERGWCCASGCRHCPFEQPPRRGTA
ncbi:MAG: DUF5522 domain-containing protein [Ilumatobacteraceae bacterium]